MQALEYKSKEALKSDLKMAAGSKDGCLTWEEFLNFFFLKNATMADRIDGNDWWNKVDREGNPILADTTPTKGETFASSEKGSTSGKKRLDKRTSLFADFKEVDVTPAMQLLMDSRRVKTEQEVEEDWANMQRRKTLEAEVGSPGGAKTKKKQPTVMLGMDEDGVDPLGFQREKSKNLLLASQIETMKEIYDRLDKYND